MDTIQIFHAALEQARDLTRDRDEVAANLHASERLNATVVGKYQQACAELESVKLALSQAQSVASGRMAMIYELSAQLSTLGTFATTIAGEVRRILDKVSEIVPPSKAEEKQPEPPIKSAITDFEGTENMEVDMVGPFVGKEEDKPNVPFAPKLRVHQTGTPAQAARATHLLSETAIPSPAFLHRGGLPNDGELSITQMATMNYRERRAYTRHGTIPERFLR